jgi:HlyD family secretion protein
MRVGRIGIAVVALAAVIAGYVYWNVTQAEDEEGYVTATLDRGAVVSAVTATGTVNPVSTVQVGTYVSGPIQAIDVDFNSPVRKGQRVAKIDPAAFTVKVQRSEANLANARAGVEKARADLALKRLAVDRYRELRGRDLVAQNDLDTASSNFQQAQAQLEVMVATVKQAEADVAEARINLAYTDITSPVDGVVVSRNVDVGQTVAASFQTPTLFLIAQDLTKMQVNASVSESDIGGVQTGQAATFSVDAYPGRSFQGTVTQVRNAPITVQNVVTYDVIIAVDNTSLELKPGMTATITIVAARRDDVLRVPIRALSFNPPRTVSSSAGEKHKPKDQGTAVWRLAANGSLERIALTVGLRDEQHAEVQSGEVAAGDQVVLALRRPSATPIAGRPPGLPRMR